MTVYEYIFMMSNKLLKLILCLIKLIDGSIECHLRKIRPRFQSYSNVHSTNMLKLKMNDKNVSYIQYNLWEIII